MLLNMLKISPFTYGLDVLKCYDNGSVYDPSILDITGDDIRAKFMGGVTNIACVSLAIGYPTVASAPHSIANGFKNLMAVAAVTDIEFAQVNLPRDFNPHAPDWFTSSRDHGAINCASALTRR